MTAAGAAAGTAAAAAQRKFGLDDEAHVAHIDLDAANTFHEGLFNAESETADFVGLVIIVRLIQSQGETRAASAAGSEIDTDAGLGLVSEERFKLNAGIVGKVDHGYLQ